MQKYVKSGMKMRKVWMDAQFVLALVSRELKGDGHAFFQRRGACQRGKPNSGRETCSRGILEL